MLQWVYTDGTACNLLEENFGHSRSCFLLCIEAIIRLLSRLVLVDEFGLGYHYQCTIEGDERATMDHGKEDDKLISESIKQRKQQVTTNLQGLSSKVCYHYHS